MRGSFTREFLNNYIGRPAARSLAIRVTVDGLRTAHSLTLITAHPFRLRAWVTRRSLRRFVWILSRQKAAFVRGRYLQEQPCQKQPSTKTATLRAGQAKSGLPLTGQCLRYPLRPAAQSNLPSGNSVVVLPREWIAAMILDRISFGTWSMTGHFSAWNTV